MRSRSGRMVGVLASGLLGITGLAVAAGVAQAHEVSTANPSATAETAAVFNWLEHLPN